MSARPRFRDTGRIGAPEGRRRPWVPASRLAPALILGIALAAAPAAADYRQSYLDGRRALERGDLVRAVELLEEAARERPVEQARARLVGAIPEPYLPHHYLGLAHYRARRCPEALAAWELSERQGAVRAVAAAHALARRHRAECESLAAAGAEIERAAEAAAALERTRAAADLAPGTRSALSRLEEARASLEAGRRDWDFERVAEALESARTAAAVLDTLVAETRRPPAPERAAERDPAAPAGQAPDPVSGPDAERAGTGAARRLPPGTEPGGPARGVAEGLDRPGTTGAEPGPGGSDPRSPTSSAGDRPPLEPGAGTRMPGALDPGSSGTAGARSTPGETGTGTSPEPGTEPGAGTGAHADSPLIEGSAAVDLPPDLLAGIQAYFDGDYRRALTLLGSGGGEADPAPGAGRRTAFLAALFRGAARHTLYLLGGERDGGLLRAARADLAACRRADPGFAPRPDHFSPRFVAFYAALP